MRNSKRTLIIAIILVFIFIPLLFAKIISISVFSWISADNDWIGFWGGYLGGILTLGGVALTINHSWKVLSSTQRLSILPYLAILENKVMDEATPIVHISLINTPEENIKVEDCLFFFRRLVIKGIFKSIGMGHATNCKIDDIFVEKKKIKYSTGKQSVFIQNDETPFCIELLDFGLLKGDLSEIYIKKYNDYFYGDIKFPEQPILEVAFKVYFEDVTGNKYKQNVLFGFIIPTGESFEFYDEECFYLEINRPECYQSISNSLI
jgi:hypothetical protein